MRDSRSGLSPGIRRSISLSINGGMTLFCCKARPRKIIIVTETIEHASNGHMKRPPFAKNPKIDIHGFRRFDSYPGNDHRFVKIVKRIIHPILQEAECSPRHRGSEAIVRPEPIAMQTFANASFDLFSVIFRFFTCPLRSI